MLAPPAGGDGDGAGEDPLHVAIHEVGAESRQIRVLRRALTGLADVDR